MAVFGPSTGLDWTGLWYPWYPRQRLGGNRVWCQLSFAFPFVAVAVAIAGLACSGASPPTESAARSDVVAHPAAAPRTRVADPEARYAVERSHLIVGGQRLALHLPQGREAPVPSVLVFHSAMGRTESVLEWCDRLAERGFAAVALDFYGERIAKSPAEGRVLRDSANERSALLKGTVEQAWEEMQNDDRLRSSKRFLLGWSFGGAWATYSSGFLSDISGVVAFYGEAFTDDQDLVNVLQAPILFVGGENDTTPTPSTLQEIVARLESNGKVAELLLVRAGHGFAERNHPGYNPEVADDAWNAVIRFLEANAI